MPTYGPALVAANLDDVMGGSGGPAAFYADGYTNNGVYIDDSDDPQWHLNGWRFSSVNLLGATSIISAHLKFFRDLNDNSGATGTCRIRCEASNAPLIYSSVNQPGVRTYRAAFVDNNFPASAADQNVDVTTLIADLLAAGYSYSGGPTDAIAFAVGADFFGLPPVVYRTIGWDRVHGSNFTQLTIVYAAGMPPRLWPLGGV